MWIVVTRILYAGDVIKIRLASSVYNSAPGSGVEHIYIINIQRIFNVMSLLSDLKRTH